MPLKRQIHPTPCGLNATFAVTQQRKRRDPLKRAAPKTRFGVRKKGGLMPLLIFFLGVFIGFIFALFTLIQLSLGKLFFFNGLFFDRDDTLDFA